MFLIWQHRLVFVFDALTIFRAKYTGFLLFLTSSVCHFPLLLHRAFGRSVERAAEIDEPADRKRQLIIVT